jgi:hypothetical protein
MLLAKMVRNFVNGAMKNLKFKSIFKVAEDFENTKFLAYIIQIKALLLEIHFIYLVRKFSLLSFLCSFSVSVCCN